MSTVIETRNLSKNYKKFKALENVSISVNKGEIYGFLGLNGAGKTTTIKALLGLIRASSGEAMVLGKNILRGGRGPWDKVGSLVETPSAYPELTVRQNLDAIRKLRGLSADSVISIMKKLKIDRYADKKSGELSLGNQQRLGLAKAMIHNPEVLILDEPANGLDPEGIVEIRNLFRDLSENHGKTIFVSSHHLEEISKTASRIGIIHNGRLLQEVNSSGLETLRKKELVIGCRDAKGASDVLNKERLFFEHRDNRIIIKDEKALAMPEEITRVLSENSFPPFEIFTREENLESYFLRIIGSTEKDTEDHHNNKKEEK